MDILFGPTAAVVNGLSTLRRSAITLATDKQHVEFHRKTLYKAPNLDKENFLREGVWNEQRVLIPSPERTVVEYIKYQDILDEGELCQAVDFYCQQKDGDLSQLYEVAKVFGASKQEVDKWVYEARHVGY